MMSESYRKYQASESTHPLWDYSPWNDARYVATQKTSTRPRAPPDFYGDQSETALASTTSVQKETLSNHPNVASPTSSSLAAAEITSMEIHTSSAAVGQEVSSDPRRPPMRDTIPQESDTFSYDEYPWPVTTTSSSPNTKIHQSTEPLLTSAYEPETASSSMEEIVTPTVREIMNADSVVVSTTATQFATVSEFRTLEKTSFVTATATATVTTTTTIALLEQGEPRWFALGGFGSMEMMTSPATTHHTQSWHVLLCFIVMAIAFIHAQR
ncbi:uncharacterized protein BYT42DRAFT_627936 [Radiomyces spectabilis]|uniref:uncharacterized protein n=1 Tax=Radiomyces spectabilis TaxID=64574 RepID=UPI00221FD1C9|nr:uncharacterized protein BYT42DRAFT_627936 [Radiomyces spectabilis]KAI8390826.1 hypothetical protein BYT42DRAFT_627936 [Radiomyces spectabilis]